MRTAKDREAFADRAGDDGSRCAFYAVACQYCFVVGFTEDRACFVEGCLLRFSSDGNDVFPRFVDVLVFQEVVYRADGCTFEEV